jgi:hypothetical protein
MKLYVDEDSVARALIGMLRKVGYDVSAPAEVGLGGADDSVQFRRAIRDYPQSLAVSTS